MTGSATRSSRTTNRFWIASSLRSSRWRCCVPRMLRRALAVRCWSGAYCLQSGSRLSVASLHAAPRPGHASAQQLPITCFRALHL